jgi:predicted secreted Zn-dependent protease
MTLPDTTPPTVSISAPANGSSVFGTVALSATASDNKTVTGLQFQIDGVNQGALQTAPPYAWSWDSRTVADGTHRIGAIAVDAAGNTSASTVSVLVANQPVIDAVVSSDQGASVTTVATSAFSTTTGNELLLAFISSGPATSSTTVKSVSGAGLTWVFVKRTNNQKGATEIWRAFATTALTNVAVTATLSQAATSSMTVVSFSNVDTSGTSGSGAIGATASATATSGSPAATLKTTRANSWVFGVGNDVDNPIGRTVGPNQQLVHQYMPPAGGTYWVQQTTTTIALSGTSVTINDTAPTGDRYNLTICEIRSRP